MNYTKIIFIGFLVLCLITLSAADLSHGQTGGLSLAEREEMASRFAPVLYLHPEENYYPISPDYAISRSDLININTGLVSNNPTASQLALLTDPYAGYYLDNRMGTVKDYGIRDDFLENSAQYPPTVYARVTTENYYGQNVYAIQYYFYYAFNEGPLNMHEGDWEMIMVVCDMSREPIFATYSQHLGGGVADWELVETADRHPKVYVALGSHANYFRSYEGGLGPAADVCSDSGRVLSPNHYRIDMLENHGWVNFAGHWGDYGSVRAGMLGERGPMGPAYQGARWDRPIVWAEGLTESSEGWFTINWVVANMLWILLGIMTVALVLAIVKIHRRKKKQGTLGPRFTPFLYMTGANARSVAHALAIIAIIIGMAGYFLPWYSVTIDIAAGEYSTPGAVEIVTANGVNGISFTRPEPGAGLVQIAGLPIPFAWLMLFGVIVFLVGTIGVARCRKFGFKLVGRGIGLLVPAFLLIFLVSIVGSFVSGYVNDAPPEIMEIIDTVSASPVMGTTTRAIGDYGTATLAWGIGPGVVLFIIAAVLLFISAVLLIMDDGRYFQSGGQQQEYPAYQPPGYGQYQPYTPPPPGYGPPPPGAYGPPGMAQPCTIYCPGCNNPISIMPGTGPFQCQICGTWNYPPDPISIH